MGLLTTKVGSLFALEQLQQTTLLPDCIVVVLLFAYHLLGHVSHFQLLRHLKPFAHIGQALCMTLSRPNELDKQNQSSAQASPYMFKIRFVNASLLSKSTACTFNLHAKMTTMSGYVICQLPAVLTEVSSKCVGGFDVHL